MQGNQKRKKKKKKRKKDLRKEGSSVHPSHWNAPVVYSKIVLRTVRAISQGLNVAQITPIMNREVCVCACVCVCVCEWVWVCVRVCVSVHVCECVCMCVCECACVWVCVWVCMCVHVCVCVCVCECRDRDAAFLCILNGTTLAGRWPATRFLNYLCVHSACFGNALNKNNGLSFNKSHCEDSTYQTTPCSLEANIGHVWSRWKRDKWGCRHLHLGTADREMASANRHICQDAGYWHLSCNFSHDF